MFSGIIEYLGKTNRVDTGESPKLVVDAPGFLKDVGIGDSISVNGVCLTVTELNDKDGFAADVMPETLRKTDLGELKTGSPVNLEKSLMIGDRLGGHFVSGHVDTAGRVAEMREEKNAIVMKFTMDASLMEFVASKGSIAIDGISLTVIDIGPDWFTVSLIPHTLKMTTLGSKQVGSTVNIEVDMLARYIRKQP
ncbi:MAG: riboflavin synthase [Actinomycetota bacterium]